MTIYTDILNSIYILIHTMPNNPVIYIYPQTSFNEILSSSCFR